MNKQWGEEEAFDFFAEMDWLEQKDAQAERDRIYHCKERLKRMSFMWQMDEMIRWDKVAKIKRRLDKVTDFDIWQYYVDYTINEKFRMKSRQRSMLKHILCDLYNYHAFGHLDVYLKRMIRPKRVTFLNLRRYYKKYTGIEDGPRSIEAREKRKLLVEMLGRQKEKDNDNKFGRVHERLHRMRDVDDDG